jgi:hypothetical protein
LKVRTSSTVELLDLSERLRQIPGIEGTQTTIVMKTQFDQPAAISGSDADTPRHSGSSK